MRVEPEFFEIGKAVPLELAQRWTSSRGSTEETPLETPLALPKTKLPESGYWDRVNIGANLIRGERIHKELEKLEIDNVGFTFSRTEQTPNEIKTHDGRSLFVSSADLSLIQAQLKTGVATDFYEIGKDITPETSARWMQKRAG